LELDQRIYNLLINRDETGVSLLYENYSGSLNGIAYRVLGHQEAAEDALQKSFLKIWNSIEQFDSAKSTLFTWMARIVRNTAIDTKRLKSFSMIEKSDSLDIHVHDSKSSSEDGQLDATRLIEGLDEKYAFVIEYLYMKGYSQRELADEFDIPLGTIKTRVKKGLDILRSKLDNEKGFILGSIILILVIIILI